MLQDNPFADLIPAQPQQVPGVIYGRPKQPTALELNREARAAAAADRQADAATRSAAAFENDVAESAQSRQRQTFQDSFSNATKLADDYNRDPAVKAYQQAVPAYASALESTNNPQGDLNLIYAFAKVLDPDSVVREGEAASVANSDTLYGRTVARLQKELGAGGTFSDTARNNLRQELRIRISQLNDAYMGARNRYKDQATRFGVEPISVVGEHLGARFQDTESRFLGRPVQEGDYRGNPVGPRPETTEGGDIGRTVQALTISNIADLASGLSGGRYDINRDGTISYNGEPVEISDQVANSEDYQAAYIAKFGEAPPLQVSVTGGDGGASQPDGRNLAVSRGGGGFGEKADAFVRGAADTVLLGGADELAGAVRSAMTGEDLGQAITRERNVDAYDNQNNFGARLTGQIAGGFVLPTGGARTAGELARVGGAYGAGYGFGSSVGDVGQRIPGTIAGGITGSATAAGLGLLGNSLANRLSGGAPGGGGNPAGRELMAAAQRQGIDVLPADVGGPLTRRMTAGAAQAPFASGPVVRAADNMQAQAGARLGQIAGTEGAPLRQEALGELATNAAQGYIDRTGAAARQAYGSARDLAGDATLRGERAVANIDAQLAELAATSNTDASLIAGLERFRADLANEGNLSNLSVDAIRRLRTSTRAEAMTEGLRGTDYQRRAGQVLDALSEDIAGQLSPEAARAFRAADRAYAERLNMIDDVMENVIGPRGDRSAEAVSNRLIQMSRGDSARLRSFLNAVNPEEAGIVRGSLIQEMGRSTSGQQNAAGDAFSLQTFLTNWDKMPERTRGLLFRGDNRQAIEDLARVAEGARASRAYANTSGTAGAVNASRTVSEVGRLTSTAGALASFGGSVILEHLSGRLLASQRFAQWLTRAPRNPERRGQWVARLGQIASREPAIANDILPLQQALQSSVSRAAAGENEQNRR